MRASTVRRKTSETVIDVQLALDGSGNADIETASPFLTHMLEQVACHSRMRLTIRAQGDTQIDDHHLVEDVGIALGQAITQAIGDKQGIRRYGFCSLPMDEALVHASIDLSGRAWLAWNLPMPTSKVGNFDTELAREFFAAIAHNGMMSLHVDLIRGANSHHIIEAAFKSFARALRQAVSIEPGGQSEIPSTKGRL